MSEIFAAGYERIGTLLALKIKYIFLLSQCHFFLPLLMGCCFAGGLGVSLNITPNKRLIKILFNLFVFLKKKFNKKSITWVGKRQLLCSAT